MPTPPSVSPQCDGLLIRVGVHLRSHAAALKLAKTVVRRHLETGWRVSPLHRRGRDFEVTTTKKNKHISVGTAWNYVHKLNADRDVADAEPLLTIQGIEPDPDHVDQQFTPGEKPRAKLRRALAAEFRTGEDKFEDTLREVGHEILFHVATNVGLRSSIENRIKGVRAKSKRGNRQLSQHSSTTLKKILTQKA